MRGKPAMSVDSFPVWAVIPATGIGNRMQADRPKQYLKLGEQSILQHTLDRLLSHPQIDGAILVLHSQDQYWNELNYRSAKPLLVCTGGAQRHHSVFNGLQLLGQQSVVNPLVLIHDAVRPFVSHDDLSRLIELAVLQQDGALLATAVADTLKLADETPRVIATQSRKNLWRALTPQAFRLAAIQPALQSAIEKNLSITDDASAMELAGFHPQLVSSASMNFKITTPDDLLLAQFIVQSTAMANND
jgi:2-C-methyl-D-erythritol 4-phosphate cytidylyltransferase